MKIKIITCLIIGALFSTNSNAQRGGITPPSIEASSLGIYGDIPVDLSKGTTNIDIPIHTISVGNENFPITLNYNASGIKVDQQASSTGLGWVMNNSALVTRVVNGLPDDLYNSPPVDLIANPNLSLHPFYYEQRQFTSYPKAGYFYSKEEVNSVMDLSSSVLSYNNNGGFGSVSYSDVAMTAAQKQTMRKLAMGALDSEPDEFYFNLFGVSGKFIFDADKNIHLLSKSPMTIIPTITASGIEKFKIITPSGVTYHFELKETTQNHHMSFYHAYGKPSNDSSIYKYINYFWYCINCVANSEVDLGSSFYNFDNPTNIFKNYDPRRKSPTFTSTWRVTKIEIPSVSDILFSYESRRVLNFHHSKTTEANEWQAPSHAPANAPVYNGIKKAGTVENYSVSASITDEKFLTKIDWHTGSISFNNLDRLDIPDININATYTLKTFEGKQTFAPPYQFLSEKSRLVSGIEITDMLKGNKSFNFSHSYFETDNCPTTGTVWQANCKRLRLDGIVMNDGSNYKFEYENQFKIPSPNSLKKDFWGYYNGYDNTDEIPTLYYYSSLYGNLQDSEHFSCFSIYPLQGPSVTINNAQNMIPNINYAKTGTLKKITYPTKGYSEFEYELNTFLLDGQERPGPGLRIKKMKHNDLISPINEITYSYKNSSGIASGNLPMLPTFTQLKRNPIASDGSSAGDLASELRGKAIFYSTNNSIGRTHSVDYSTVTVSTVGNGKEEYVFDVPLKIGQKRHFNTSSGYVFDISFPKFKIHPEHCVYHMSNGTSNYHEHYSTFEVLDYFPFASVPNYSWNTGQLLQKHTYNAAGQKIRSIINTYDISGIEKNYYFKTAISYAHQFRPGSSVTTSPSNDITGENTSFNTLGVTSSYFEHYLFEEGTYDYYYTKPYYLFAFKSLTKTEEINYMDNGQITTTKENGYGTDLQIKNITTSSSSNGEKNIVRYKHITDFANNSYLGTTAIGNPIEIVYEKTLPEDATHSIVTGGEIFNYTNNLIAKHYKLNSDKKISRKLSDLNYTATGYYKNLSIDGSGNIAFDPSYELFSEYLQYDAFGNCLEFKTDYGTKYNTFIFGYDDKLLVASILNGTYSQVGASTNLSSLRTATGSALKIQLDAIRAGLPDAMITTYNYFDRSFDGYSKYKLESITNPLQKSIFYNYYNSGKLRFIKDNNQKVIEEFKYNNKIN
ncbi:hypothetical protein NAT51_00520 [Flavobacterium amniphilum]|uniref:hypothetical protein n=1 Tax=Flavobacterium amniphilum TaxID=1834035 RepID=UPI00202A9D60|nr:hypothetical protein [Flavobacterium amniphilum]MCL9803986.1 hypothetical protein [Flavobacterium amniphilum]